MQASKYSSVCILAIQFIPSMSAHNDFSLRLANLKDIDFAFQVIYSHFYSYAIASLGNWNSDEVKQKEIQAIERCQTQIIELRGEPIGILRATKNSGTLQLDMLCIVEQYQGMGIGTIVLQSLIHEARIQKLPLCLRVLRTNPAKRFYERLGFIVTHMTKERFMMAIV